jgi:hypothetical protein
VRMRYRTAADEDDPCRVSVLPYRSN